MSNVVVEARFEMIAGTGYNNGFDYDRIKEKSEQAVREVISSYFSQGRINRPEVTSTGINIAEEEEYVYLD